MIDARCTICGQAMPGNRQEWPDFPFCSPRCRLIDLGRWLGESYRIPSEADGEEEPPEEAESELP